MYDCDEYGLNDTMERNLHKQYREEQQDRKEEIIRILNNNECDNCEREGYIHALRSNYNHEYKPKA
jgi:hypothetical protein